MRAMICCPSGREMENMDPMVKWGPDSPLDKLDRSDCGQAQVAKAVWLKCLRMRVEVEQAHHSPWA